MDGTHPVVRRSVAALVVAALLGACGTTQIATNDTRARIYVDGRMEGVGRAEVSQTGLPRTAVVIAKAPDGRSTTVQIKRRFTVGTFVLGLLTYGVCLLVCWNYPDSVFVPLEERATAAWGDGADPWLSPPAGWAPPAAPAAAPPPPATAPGETTPPPAAAPPGPAP
jgi:hypothetical protein